MEPKTVRPKAIEIQRRFFQAIGLLTDLGRIRGIGTFCSRYNLSRSKYSNLKSHSDNPDEDGARYKFIDIDALYYLVEDYGISANWLLLGKGNIFQNEKSSR